MEFCNLSKLIRDIAKEVSKYGCDELNKHPTVYIEKSDSLGFLIRYSGDKQHAISCDIFDDNPDYLLIRRTISVPQRILVRSATVVNADKVYRCMGTYSISVPL